ncbi:hypothetical protein [Amycolatopsis keratiniphila]|uniref:hypothetical protein n=1 Tax=Amycolatopsis keratiniphila TaxID=129921 RepID=UPI000A7B2373|nr:hypothetical protein [Amycolatopsis keratiniphila]
MRRVFAGSDGRRRVFARRAAISAGAAAGYGALLLVAFSGVPDLPTALDPRPFPLPQSTPKTPVPSSTPPPAAPPPGPRTASAPEARGAPEPVREPPRTSAEPPPARTTAQSAQFARPAPPDTRADAAAPRQGGDRRNGRAPENPPKQGKTTPPKSERSHRALPGSS